MSHSVQIQTQVKDAAAIRAACQRLNLPAPVQGKTNLFRGDVEGLALQLPDWVYPVVVYWRYRSLSRLTTTSSSGKSCNSFPYRGSW